MPTAKPKSGRKPPKTPHMATAVQFLGITTAARELGVSVNAVRGMLTGQITAEPLARRCYAKFPALFPPETIAKYGLAEK